MPAHSAVRSRLVGLVAGVLLLLALVGLAVVLPRLEGEAVSASGAPEVTLPVEAGDYVSVEEQDPANAAAVRERLDSAASRLEDLYGVPVSLALYTAPSEGGQAPAAGQLSLVVTALAAPDGLFLPTGPAPDPELVGLARNPNELVRVGDALCNVAYGQPVPEGQEADPAALPTGVQCQRTTEDGVTFQVDGTGLDAEDTARALDEVVAGSTTS